MGAASRTRPSAVVGRTESLAATLQSRTARTPTTLETQPVDTAGGLGGRDIGSINDLQLAARSQSTAIAYVVRKSIC